MSFITHNKKLGQHFLYDSYWLTRIADEIKTLYTQSLIKDSTTTLYEIGAGDGALTKRLAHMNLPVIAIEFDKRRIIPLQNKFAKFDSITIIHADILDFTFDPSQSICLIGNLPYNISSQIILRFAENPQVYSMLFLVQREMALRLTSAYNSRHYGVFTLLASMWRTSWCLCDVPAESFTPPPQVTSTLVQLGEYTPRIFEKNTIELFRKLVRQGFQQRRKYVANSLRSLVDECIWDKVELNPHMRAENLSFEDWLHLTHCVQKCNTNAN